MNFLWKVGTVMAKGNNGNNGGNPTQGSGFGTNGGGRRN